jgi:hypothetical protein
MVVSFFNLLKSLLQMQMGKLSADSLHMIAHWGRMRALCKRWMEDKGEKRRT